MSDLAYYEKQLEENKSTLSTLKTKLTSLQRTGGDTSVIQEQITKVQSLVSSLTSKVAALQQESSSSSSDSLTSSLTDSLKSAGVDTSSASSTASSYLSSVSDTVADTLSDIAASATDLASTSVSSLSSAAKSAASSLFGSSDSTAAALSSAKADTGTAETDSKIRSISSDNNTAIAETVAFVTKPVTETVQSAKSAETTVTKETVPTTGQLATEAKKLKENGSDGSLSSTITAISNDLSSKIKSASEWATETKNGVTTENGSLLDSVSSTVKNGISSTLEFASPVTSTASSVITAGKDLTKQVVDALPTPVGKYITKTTDDFLASTSASLLGSKLDSLKNIAKIIPGVTDTSSLWSIVQGLGGSYSSIVDSLTGKNLSKTMGSANSTSADALYSAANTICNNINRPSTYNYSQNKDLFDTLLSLAAQMGLTDLLTQLSKCTSGQNSYFDSRSKNLLKSMTRQVASSGNVTGYKALVEVIGSANVSDAKKDVAILAANTSSSDAKEDSSTWTDTVTMLGFTPMSVVQGSTAVGDAYSGTTVSLMSASNTTIIDSVIPSDDRALVQASMYQFA